MKSIIFSKEILNTNLSFIMDYSQVGRSNLFTWQLIKFQSIGKIN